MHERAKWATSLNGFKNEMKNLFLELEEEGVEDHDDDDDEEEEEEEEERQHNDLVVKES